jgi:O-antigen/teichoic acid export membrane protein
MHACRSYNPNPAQNATAPNSPTAPPLGRSFSWTLLSTLVYAGCQWGTLVLLTKIGTPEMVGQYALALGVTAPVILLAGLGLRTLMVTDARHQYCFGDYFGLRLLMSVLTLVAIIVISICAKCPVDTALVITMVAVAKTFDSLSDVIYGFLQQHERMDRIAVSRIIQGVLQIVAFALATYLTRNLLCGTAAMALASGSVTAGYDIPTAASVAHHVSAGSNRAPARAFTRLAVLRPYFSLATIVALVRSSVPLAIVTTLASLSANMPRYFIEIYRGDRELGIFTAMSSLIYPGGMIAGALCQSAWRRLSQYHVDDFRAFQRLLIKLIALGAANGLVGILVAALFGRPVLTLLYRREYADRPGVFAWLMTAAALSYVATAMGVGMQAARAFTALVGVHCTSTVITALACAWLIPQYNLMGAAWALCIGISAWIIGCAAIMVRLKHDRRTPALQSFKPAPPALNSRTLYSLPAKHPQSDQSRMGYEPR